MKYTIPFVHPNNPDRKPFPAIAGAITATPHSDLAAENARLRAKIAKLEAEKRDLEKQLE